jgi:N-acetyl-beta-hexosaminidase
MGNSCNRYKDKPRFQWRGLMLDLSRHFFKRIYFKTIDRLAMHKMNVLHLHLVDDQGWRIKKSTRINPLVRGGLIKKIKLGMQSSK